jgi:hypothetical protein
MTSFKMLTTHSDHFCTDSRHFQSHTKMSIKFVDFECLALYAAPVLIDDQPTFVCILSWTCSFLFISELESLSLDMIRWLVT